MWTIVDQHKNKFGEHRKITLTTETMFNSKFDRGFGTSTRYKYRLPSCKAVNYSHKYFSVDPYIIGVFLGDGCCTEKALTISSTDDFIVSKIKNLLNAYEVYSSQTNYSHKFYKAAGKLFQTKEVFKDYPEVIGTS